MNDLIERGVWIEAGDIHPTQKHEGYRKYRKIGTIKCKEIPKTMYIFPKGNEPKEKQ